MSNTLQYILQLQGNFNPTFNQFNKNVQRTSNAINAIQVAAGNMLSSIAGKVASVSRSIFDEIYNGTVKREQDIAGLFTFVGDRASEVYRNIQKDAAVTPFDTQSLLDVNRSLISAGVNANAARQDSLNLANAISAVGKGNAELSNMAANMQQIRTVGKASQMDIKQFAFAGINIYKLLSDATGKSVADVQKMEVSYDLLSQALAKAAAKGGLYEGALARQGKTLGAMMESAKDTMGIAFADFGDTLRPLFEKGLTYLQSFVDKLPGMLQSIQPFVMMLGDAFFWVVDRLKDAAQFVRYLWQAFQEGNPILIFLATLVTTIVAYQVVMQLAAWGTALWTGAQWLLNAALSANPIGLIIAGIIALIALIGFLIYKVDGWGNAWKHTVQGAKLTWSAFTAFAKWEFDTFINAIMIGIDKIKLGWYEFKNAIGIGDESANNAVITQINADTEARKKAMVDGAKNVANLGAQAMNEFAQANNSLKWNNKGFGDLKKSISDKLGIGQSGIPGANIQSNLPTSSADGGKSGKSAQTVATGGQKNVTVNVSIAQMAQGWQIKVDSLEDGIDQFQERVMEALTRSVAMGAALGGEN